MHRNTLTHEMGFDKMTKQIGALPPPPTSTTGSSSGSVTDTSVGPASVMVGNLVQGNRLAMAQGRDLGLSDDHDRKVSRKTEDRKNRI